VPVGLPGVGAKKSTLHREMTCLIPSGIVSKARRALVFCAGIEPATAVNSRP
jgi:hypothetical protein